MDSNKDVTDLPKPCKAEKDLRDQRVCRIAKVRIYAYEVKSVSLVNLNFLLSNCIIVQSKKI